MRNLEYFYKIRLASPVLLFMARIITYHLSESSGSVSYLFHCTEAYTLATPSFDTTYSYALVTLCIAGFVHDAGFMICP